MIALVDVGWAAAIVIVVGTLVCGVLLLVFVSRDRRSHKVRVGFFVEREDNVEQTEEPPSPPYSDDDAPTLHG